MNDSFQILDVAEEEYPPLESLQQIKMEILPYHLSFQDYHTTFQIHIYRLPNQMLNLWPLYMLNYLPFFPQTESIHELHQDLLHWHPNQVNYLLPKINNLLFKLFYPFHILYLLLACISG